MRSALRFIIEKFYATNVIIKAIFNAYKDVTVPEKKIRKSGVGTVICHSAPEKGICEFESGLGRVIYHSTPEKRICESESSLGRVICHSAPEKRICEFESGLERIICHPAPEREICESESKSEEAPHRLTEHPTKSEGCRNQKELPKSGLIKLKDKSRQESRTTGN